jgi:hypothetical protein
MINIQYLVYGWTPSTFLEAPRNTVFRLVFFCQPVLGKDQRWACLKRAIKAAQTNCANLASVNWDGVTVAKVIWSFCRCNFIALVFLANDAIHQ